MDVCEVSNTHSSILLITHFCKQNDTPGEIQKLNRIENNFLDTIFQ